MAHLVGAGFLLGDQATVVGTTVVQSNGAKAVGQGLGLQLRADLLKHQPIDVGKLVALLIHHVIVGIAHRRPGPVGAVGAEEPRPKCRPLGIEGMVHLPEKLLWGNHARTAETLDQLLITFLGVKRLHIVLGAGHIESTGGAGLLLQPARVRLGEDVAHGVVVNLFNIARASVDLHGLVDTADIGIKLHLPPPPHDIFGRERNAIRPPDPASQRHGPYLVVIGGHDLASQVRAHRFAVRRKPHQRVVLQLILQHQAHAIDIVDHAPPVAAIDANAGKTAIDSRFGSHSLRHRRQLALLNQVGKHWTLTFRPPGGLLAVAVVDILPEIGRLRRVQNRLAQTVIFRERLRVERDRPHRSHPTPQPHPAKQQYDPQSAKGRQHLPDILDPSRSDRPPQAPVTRYIHPFTPHRDMPLCHPT